MTVLIGNQLNVVTSLTGKTWAQLGWNSSNISKVFFLKPEDPGVIMQSWNPLLPFSALTGTEVGGQYIVEPKIELVNTSDFYEYISGDVAQSSTLIANQVNVRTSAVTRTWFQLGWSSINIDKVFLIDPNDPAVILQSWNPLAPYSPITGLTAGKKYMIQPKVNITLTDVFALQNTGAVVNLPISTVMLTSFDEFGYDTELVSAQTDYGGGKTLNAVYDEVKIGKTPDITDFTHMMREDAAKVPGLVNGTGEMITWVNWFTEGTASKGINGLNNPTTVRPMLQESTFWSIVSTATTVNEFEQTVSDNVTPTPLLEKDKWRVGPYNLVKTQLDSNNKPVAKIPGALKGSGSMNDESFVNGMLALQNGTWKEGTPAPPIKVGLVPVVIAMRPVTNVPATAGMFFPQVVDGSNYSNWRGYITFNSEAAYDFFAAEYEAFVKHYIDLCYDNGINLSTIYVGSEFEALLTADYKASDIKIHEIFPNEFDYLLSPGAYAPANKLTVPAGPNFHILTETMTITLPIGMGGGVVPFRRGIQLKFMELLGNLGLYAKTKFPTCTTTYAANWTDYNKPHELWLHEGIDAIGIDWYMPLSEIHTNDPQVFEDNFLKGEQGIVDVDNPPYTYDPEEIGLGFLAGNNKLSVMSTLMNAPGSTVLADGGIGKSGITTIPITDTSYAGGLKRVFEYYDYLTTLAGGTFTKPIIATELGAASMKGASVEPNVFPYVLGAANVGASIVSDIPAQHNMKPLLEKLESFNFFIADIVGAYGSSFEMDQEHQFLYLKTMIDVMTANGITKHVIYTLDARPSGMFGATIFNTALDPAQDEVYTFDTPVFPLNLAINGKKAGGWDQAKTELASPNDVQNLMDRLLPVAGNAVVIPESTASQSFRSFVSTDIYDYEWKANTDLPNGYTIVPDNGVSINPGKTATGNAGRFAYFRSLGDLTVETKVRISGRLNFEAKGDGDIEVIIFGQATSLGITYEMFPQARRVFTLTADYQLFGWTLPLLFPQQEFMIGVFFKGGGPSATTFDSKASATGVTAEFKKNFCLILDQAGMDVEKPFYRVRADQTTLLGNAETDWYGWSDRANESRIKYLQSSAFSRFRVETDATELALEFVRDTYNTEPKNIYYNTFDKGGRVIANTNGGWQGFPGTYLWGATNNHIKVEAGKKYVISGLFTGIANGGTTISMVWLSSGSPTDHFAEPRTPLSAPFTIPNLGTNTRPIYETPVAPTGAKSMCIQVQSIPYPVTDPEAEPDPRNDSFEVTRYCMIEEGGILTATDANWRILTGDPDAVLPNGPTTGGGYLRPSDIDPYNSANTLFSGTKPPIGEERLKLSGFSVFIDGNLYQYHNIEDGEIYTFHNGTTFTDPRVVPTPTTYELQGYAKQVDITTITLPPLPIGVTSREIDVVSSGRGTYLPESPLVRRAGLYFRALYIKEPNPIEIAP